MKIIKQRKCFNTFNNTLKRKAVCKLYRTCIVSLQSLSKHKHNLCPQLQLKTQVKFLRFLLVLQGGLFQRQNVIYGTVESLSKKMLDPI